MPNTAPDLAMGSVHVAVAVIVRQQGAQQEVLLSRRLKHVHQGGLWEFPGGKREPGEDIVSALDRELQEELGLALVPGAAPLPLITIQHDYGDKRVLLDVWQVLAFTGEPYGREGQEVRWVPMHALDDYAFPVANKPILTACRLPRRLVFTPEYSSAQQALSNLKQLRQQIGGLVRVRQPQLDDETYRDWLQCIGEHFRDSATWLIADRDVQADFYKWIAGIHLGQRRWREESELLSRAPAELFIGLSCHNEEELRQAERAGLDFVTLSPVQATQSHPGQAGLGWEGFRSLVEGVVMPVYALGGVGAADEQQAMEQGAQGIAAIRAWQDLLI